MTWFFYSVPICPYTGNPVLTELPAEMEWVISRDESDLSGTNHILYTNYGTLSGTNWAILTPEQAAALVSESHHLSYDELILGGGDPS